MTISPRLSALASTGRAESTQISRLLDRLHESDVRVTVVEGKLRLNAPRGGLTDALKSEIAACRDGLIAHLGAGKDGIAGSAGPSPLSSAQKRFWFLDRMSPGHPRYNIGGAVRVRGPLDLSCARAAIEHLLSRHAMLRARIHDDDGRPGLEILDHSSAEIQIVDFSDLPPAEGEAAAVAWAQRQARTEFDLASGRLACFLVARERPDQHLLAACLHHIIADAWSLALLFREMTVFAAEFAAGKVPDPSPPRLGYVQYIAKEAQRTASDSWPGQIAYWRGQLDGAPALLELPTDRPRPAQASLNGQHIQRRLDRELVQSLGAVGQARGATLFMVLLAAWQVLMHRYSGQDDIVVGTPVANRDEPGLEGVVGCFVDTLPLRTRFAPNMGFADVVEQVKQTTLDALDHRDVPFERMIELVNAPRRLDHAPVFQTMFALMPFPMPAQSGGLTVEPVSLTGQTTRLDLSLDIGRQGDELVLGYEFSSDLFDQISIEAVHRRFERLLRGLCDDPTQSVDRLPLLSEFEEAELLRAARGARLAHERTACLHDLVHGCAAGAPDKVAVRSGSDSLTYAELETRSNQLANLLVGRGIGPNAVVGVFLERGIDAIVALAGVLKAGGAYLPLDPAHPPSRVQRTLRHAKAVSVITHSALEELLESVTPTIGLDRVRDELAAQSALAPRVAVGSGDLAYVIYTSGSTGEPKGVEVEHRQIVAFLRAMHGSPGLRPDDVGLAVTTLAFDIAGLEIWGPLSVGGRVVMASREDAVDGRALARLIENEGVTVMQATPATWRLLLAGGWTGRPGLRALCGGEAMPRELAAGLLPRVGELWNMYGPTETTVWSSVARVSDSGAISIGAPIANTDIHVMDGSGRPVPTGIVGELCIAGEGVARGYRFAPDLTSERFPTREIGGKPTRLYRTGDLGRRRGDGRLECLGRRDDQIKIRGYRVELGEVESALAEAPGVSHAAVVLRDAPTGDKQLVAYVVSSAETFDAEAARRHLRTRLPEYMVPAHLLQIGELPLTPNGKLDRGALPKPEALRRSHAGTEPVMTAAERRVADVWRGVLELDGIDLHESFFDIGGHSLSLVELQAALNRAFGVELSLIDLFQHTTIAAQARRLMASDTDGDTAPGLTAILHRARERAERQSHG